MKLIMLTMLIVPTMLVMSTLLIVSTVVEGRKIHTEVQQWVDEQKGKALKKEFLPDLQHCCTHEEDGVDVLLKQKNVLVYVFSQAFFTFNETFAFHNIYILTT